MISLIDIVTPKIPRKCRVHYCDRDCCSISLDTAPDNILLVDMDCSALGIRRDKSKCNYLAIVEEKGSIWVAPIELKSGRVKAVKAIRQLQAGASFLEQIIPERSLFELVPIVAYGRNIHPVDLQELRETTISLHDQESLAVLIPCGAPLNDALQIEGRSETDRILV